MGTTEWFDVIQEHAQLALMATISAAANAGPNVELGTLQSMPPNAFESVLRCVVMEISKEAKTPRAA